MPDIGPVRITARVEIDGRIYRVGLAHLGLVPEWSDGAWLPVDDGGVTIEPRDWSAWCEANVERITAAIEAEAATHRAAVKRPRKVAEPRWQAALFAE